MLRNFAGRVGITYPLLSDPQSAVIRAFDILNDTIPAGNMAHGIPFPGSYLVNSEGIIQEKFFDENFRERNTAGEILVKELGGEANQATTTIETDHLRMRTSASDAVVSGGFHVTLELAVDLKPGMHVYAPGVGGGYIPIEWTMETSPGWQVFDAAYPKSQMLHLPVIDETVPVYEGRFRVTRDIGIAQAKALEPLLEDGRLSVTGSFTYQACDDKMCYRPVTVPLKWTFEVQAPDRTRVPEDLQRK